MTRIDLHKYHSQALHSKTQRFLKYAPSARQSGYLKQLLMYLKSDIDSNTIIVGDFNTLCHQWTDWLDRTSTTTTTKTYLIYTMEQTDLIHINRIFHVILWEHKFFFLDHGTFFKKRPHDRRQSKPQQIQKTWKQTIYLFWPPGSKAENQHLRKFEKICRHMETEYHATGWTVGHRKIIREIRNSLQHEDDNTFSDIRDTAKAMLRRKFIVTSDYIKKLEMYQIKSMHFKDLEK